MKVVLRIATDDDYELMLKWRNDPEIMNGSYSQIDGHIITWSEHLAWLQSRNKDFRIYIIYAGDDQANDDKLLRVGVITVSQMDYWEPETACYIGEKSFLGKDVAKQATRQVLDMLRSMGFNYTRLTIMDSNPRAIKHCETLGFVRVGEARPGESLYRLKL